MAGAMLIGIGATLLMDLWNLFLKRGFAMGTHQVFGLGLDVSVRMVG